MKARQVYDIDMNSSSEPIFAIYKNLLFLPNPMGKLNCIKIFGDNIFEQGHLRSRFVREGPPDPQMLKKRGFTLLDAQGDDGTVTRWMMQQGFKLPMRDGTLCLPSPSFVGCPFTINQIEAWVTEDPSLVEKMVYWEEEHKDHGLTCLASFPSYIDNLCQLNKVFNMNGRVLLGSEYQQIKDIMIRAKAQWEKTLIQEGMGEIPKTSSTASRRLM